uniref:Uncharacterized protein n=1 Tax=Panagrolaimus sp. JU765 TaxID=591449 RepID=A0AC34Q5G0_9BILA
MTKSAVPDNFVHLFQSWIEQSIEIDQALTAENLCSLRDGRTLDTSIDITHRLYQKMKAFRSIVMEESVKKLLNNESVGELSNNVSKCTTVCSEVETFNTNTTISQTIAQQSDLNPSTDENIDLPDSIPSDADEDSYVPEPSVVTEPLDAVETPDVADILNKVWASVVDDDGRKYRGLIKILKKDQFVTISMIGTDEYFCFPVNQYSMINSIDGLIVTMEFSEDDTMVDQVGIEFETVQELQSFVDSFRRIIASMSKPSDNIQKLGEEEEDFDSEKRFVCHVSVRKGHKAAYLDEGQLTAVLNERGCFITVVNEYDDVFVDSIAISYDQDGIPHFPISNSVTFGGIENGQLRIFTLEFTNAESKQDFEDFIDSY